MKKKILLLNISKSTAEIDWVLPVLHKLKDRYFIFTLFQNIKAFRTLEKDKILFSLWKEICNEFAIENFKEKIWRYLSKKIFKNYNIENYFLRKKIVLSDIEIFLSEFSTYAPIIDEIKKKNSSLKVIHFPNSAFVFSIRQENFKVRYGLKGDYLFLGNELDKIFWKKRISEDKIKIVGVPKHDKHWINKLLVKKNYSKNEKPKIVVTYSSKFGVEKKYKKNLELQLKQLMDTLVKFKKYKIVFKIHPRKNDPYYLKILKRYKDSDWEISNENLLKLASDCKIFVHDRQSSAIFDGLVLNKPCIEYWEPPQHSDYDSANDDLNINVRANNSVELENFINLAIEDPKNKIWTSQQQNYILNCKKFGDNATTIASEFIANLNKK